MTELSLVVCGTDDQINDFLLQLHSDFPYCTIRANRHEGSYCAQLHFIEQIEMEELEAFIDQNRPRIQIGITMNACEKIAC